MYKEYKMVTAGTCFDPEFDSADLCCKHGDDDVTAKLSLHTMHMCLYEHTLTHNLSWSFYCTVYTLHDIYNA